VPPRTAVEGAGAVLRLDLTVPDAADRALHWGDALRALGRRHGQAELETLAQTHRMTGGLIRRIAPGALAEAGAAGRVTVTPADVTRAARAVRAEIPVSLATRLDAAGSWDHVVVPPPTLQELRMLERRCRRREQLSAMLPATLAGGVGPGVRALFTGPSGTGKTLAARLLAGVLGKDLYRVDLAGVVDKYLGETEKNLDRVLDHAEALDVVLLIDEGDALLAKRTEVHSSNDRYANLETNYLLQRLDTFEGIVVITTNAQQHLDSAFARRLDVVIEFPAPGPAERQRLWRAHLPSDHQVDAVLLGEAAARCALTGGQVRNAVLHASLLALDDGGPVGGRQLAAAIRREYAKQGALCPLRDRSDEPRDRHQRHDRHDTPAGGGD
jgi:SpoVK/Ycf46/Vps4 family AAA+-type ATPase